MNEVTTKEMRGIIEKTLKALAAFNEVFSNIYNYGFDVKYTEDEIYKYEALTLRFQRVAETLFYFFRIYDYFANQIEHKTFRDLLHSMEKIELIDNFKLWMDIRFDRNKIAHIYLPDELGEMCNKIIDLYGNSIINIKEKIIEINNNLD